MVPGASMRWLPVVVSLMVLTGGSTVLAAREDIGPSAQQPRLLSAAMPPFRLQIPTCSTLCQQAMRGVKGKKGTNAARAVIVPPRVLVRLRSRPASIAHSRVFLSSLLEFAQQGRGPPPVSWWPSIA